jgi:hypothetical protein
MGVHTADSQDKDRAAMEYTVLAILAEANSLLHEIVPKPAPPEKEGLLPCYSILLHPRKRRPSWSILLIDPRESYPADYPAGGNGTCAAGLSVRCISSRGPVPVQRDL